MSTSLSFSPSRRLLVAVVTLLASCVALIGAPAPPASADASGALSVCDPGAYPDAASWYRTTQEIAPYVTGQTSFVESYSVGSGLVHGCASQQWASIKWECTTTSNGSSCKWVHNDFETMPLTSVPQVIDAAGGDEQAVTVNLPNATRVNWGECLPRSGLGTVSCPSSPTDTTANPGYSGTVLFRFRQPNGEFTGPWQVSQRDSFSGFQSPGFMLQAEHGACSPTATSCRWLVKFTRDTLNQPAILKDVQLLLTFSVTFKNNIGENAYIDVAVPLLVQQRGGPAGTPTPTPTVTPTPTATATATPGSPAATGTPAPLVPTSDALTPVAGPLTLRSKTVRVKRNAASVKLRCGGSEACRGKVTLRRSATSTKSLGSKRFTLKAGKRGTVKIKLSSRGRKLLKAKRKTKVELVVSYADGTTDVLPATLRR